MTEGSPLNVKCSTCGAKKGQACISKSGKSTNSHIARKRKLYSVLSKRIFAAIAYLKQYLRESR